MNKIVIAPIEVITDRNLSDPERRVLLILYSFKGKTGESVFPSIDVIAEMAGYADKTRISKITKSLEIKGWLTKKRRGFTGGNSYSLLVPEYKLAPEAKLDHDTNTKLDVEANTKLAPEAKYKEQPTEQPIEQTNNTVDHKPEKILKPKKPDYPEWFETVWNIFPERSGGDNKKIAHQKACARLKDGATTDQLLLATERYRRYIIQTGKMGTEYVKQAATFFGLMDNIENQWLSPIVGAGYGKNQQSNQQRGLDPDDTSWADKLFTNGGSQLVEPSVRPTERDISGVAYVVQNPAGGIGSAPPMATGFDRSWDNE